VKTSLTLLFILTFFAFSGANAKSVKVNNINEFNQSLKAVSAGDEIVLKNGIWKDIQFEFKAKGKKGKYIYLKAETPGGVSIEGKSCLNISGSWLHVSGLKFVNGSTPKEFVIEFRTSDKDYANNCVVSNCVIDKFNQKYREDRDNWIAMWGKYNTIENCYFGGKTNEGCLLIVCPNDSNSTHNHNHIYRNYFGPHPRLGSNAGESIRIGTGEVCTNSSETVVEENYFEHCSGEVEIISNKSCDNQIVNNVFFESEGSVVLRHGNNAVVKGNWFIGNGKPFTGGIRIINEGHRIYNNYFYKLRGDEFRSPLTIMNAIPNSPPTGYAAVKNVLFENNTYYDCALPWNLCVGVTERNRIVTPQGVTIKNNLVYCPTETELIKSYDKTDGFTFTNNLMLGKNGVTKDNGAVSGEIQKATVLGVEMVYSNLQAEKSLLVKTDILGVERSNPVVGALQNPTVKNQLFFPSAKTCGPKWFRPDSVFVKKGTEKGKTIKVKAGTDNLYEAVNKANAGDILMLDSGIHILTKKISFTKSLTIRSSSRVKSKPVIKLQSVNANDTVFEINSNVYLRVKGVKIDGEGDNNNDVTPKYCFAAAQHAMGYSLIVDNCEIFDFSSNGGGIFNCQYGTMADSIVISNSVLCNSYRGFNLAEEKRDDGRYNAETVIFNNTVFANFKDYALNYYRGGYDESTIGGSLAINHCVFDSIGKSDCQAILKLTRIMYVKINNSIFSNSLAKSSMQLWYLYDKVSRSCFYNCPKPELIKGAKATTLIFDKPNFEKNSYKLSPNSTLIGKTADGKNIGLR
jgi:poly(beta-D-mannuronate) lyase